MDEGGTAEVCAAKSAVQGTGEEEAGGRTRYCRKAWRAVQRGAVQRRVPGRVAQEGSAKWAVVWFQGET